MSNIEIFEKYLQEKELIALLKFEAECEFEEHNVPEDLAKKLIVAIFDFNLDLIKGVLEETTGVSESDLYRERTIRLLPKMPEFSAEEQKTFDERIKEDAKRFKQ